MIRDQRAWQCAGLVAARAMEGPPVYPPQPPGLWRQTGRNEPKYKTATGSDRFRRGIYTVWRRAAPYPSFVLFDGPDRTVCHPKRSRTNTPMQALALMNDRAYVEMAMHLAHALWSLGRPARDTITEAFRSVLARDPNEREQTHLLTVFERELGRFRADPNAASALVDSMKALRLNPSADREALASWFFVAQILLNLDETITKG